MTARVGKTYPLEEWKRKGWKPSQSEPFLTPYSYPARPVWPEEDLSRALDRYEASHYLNACMDVIMRSVASVPVRVMVGKSKGVWEPNEEHPLQQLLDSPNDFMTWRDLMERVAGHLVLSGNALWAKSRTGGTVVELWPLNPDWVKIKPDARKFIANYQYGEGSKARTLTPEDIVHFMRTNLRDERWGRGYVSVGRKLFELDGSAMDWNQTMLQQRGIFTNVIGIKHPLTAEQYADLKEKFARRRLGGEDAGSDLIIGADIAVNRVNATSQEMDFIESRKMTREDIASLMGVPPSVIGIYGAASADLTLARKVFWQDRIIPLMRRLEDTMNRTLVPEFGNPRKLRIEFNFDDVEAVRSIRFEKTKEFNLLVTSGVAPRAANQELQMGFQEDDVINGFLVKAEADENGEAIAPVLDPNKLDPGVGGELSGAASERPKPGTTPKPEDQRKPSPSRTRNANKELFASLYRKEAEEVLRLGEKVDFTEISIKWYQAFVEASGAPAEKVKAFWEKEMRQKLAEQDEVRRLCRQKGMDYPKVLAYSYLKWADIGAERMGERVEEIVQPSL